MDFSFLKKLDTSGFSLTTSLVIWSMILFLLVLIGALGFTLVRQLKPSVKNQSLKSNKVRPKGF